MAKNPRSSKAKGRRLQNFVRDMLKEMDKSLEMDVSDEMAELKRRLKGK